ncbi:PAS domain S-box protein [Xylophilus sp. Kf1]|nr:PAS domain S-box protein [Xylophilus sp. Kf1]
MTHPPPARRSPVEALLHAGALQDAIFDSLLFSKIATDARGVIQIFNAGAQKMMGYAAADVVGLRNLSELAEPGDLAARADRLGAERGMAIDSGFDALVARTERGIEDIFELTCIRQDGRRIAVVLSVTAMRDASQAIIGYLVIGSDNTARQQAERALLETNLKLERARAAAEKANLAKSEFLSSMSHELRSPLNAILGFAQLLDTAEPAPTPIQQDSIDQVLRAGWYLLRLIDEILDLSLIESGKVSLSTEPMSLADLLEDVQAMVEPQAARYGVTLAFPVEACPPAVTGTRGPITGTQAPTFVRADRTRIKQVLLNLLSNAIKYNRPAGAVRVACHLPAADRVRVSVSDDGEGLPPHLLAQLFQPFHRLGRQAGTEQGTGIGLVVSKRLVESMGGAIGAESTVGVGSTFWIELAAARAPQLDADADTFAPPSRVPSAQAASAPQRSVLCIEDNPANLLLIAQLIERRADLRLLTAAAGQGLRGGRHVGPGVAGQPDRFRICRRRHLHPAHGRCLLRRLHRRPRGGAGAAARPGRAGGVARVRAGMSGEGPAAATAPVRWRTDPSRRSAWNPRLTPGFP